MGKVGKALKQVLETYGITQNRLAVVMGTRRSNVGRWYHEQIDPTGDTIADIVAALRQIEPAAAEEFIWLFLSEKSEDEEQS
jgi:transcriptional regulator with XRE-family HTH domain